MDFAFVWISYSSLSTPDIGYAKFQHQRQSTLAFANDEHLLDPNQSNMCSYPYDYNIDGPSSSASGCAVGVDTHHQFEMTEAGMIRCPYCPEQCHIVRALKKHISREHANRLPFKCKECGKGFYTASSLRLHSVIHGSRRFVCSKCDFAFKHKHHLKDHLRNIHKLTPCPNCLNGFSSDEFNVHIRSCGSPLQ